MIPIYEVQRWLKQQESVSVSSMMKAFSIDEEEATMILNGYIALGEVLYIQAQIM